MKTFQRMGTLTFALAAACGAMEATLGTARGQAGPVIADDVKDHIRRRVDEGGTPGIAVGLISAEGAAFFAHGLSSKGGAKLDEDSVFEIGSITKAFTAMLLADAVIEGRLKLDDPVAGLLPSHVKFPTRGDRPVTLEHLATHRSGLPRLPDNFEPANDQDPYADYTVERLYAFLSDAELLRNPGEEYEYSNLGAGLLGHVLALKAGKRYDELVRERICLPLGMKDTACGPTAAMKERLAQGHAGGQPVPNWNLADAVVGAGGLCSTPRDMTRFLSACLGLTGDKLQPVLAKCLEMRHPTVDPVTQVSLGWHVDTKHGVDIFWHNGGTGGYHSYCGFRLDQRLGVVVLTNSDDAIEDVGKHLLEPKAPLSPIRPMMSLEAAALEEYVGYYQLAPGVMLHVTRQGATLHAQLTGQADVPVFAEAKDKFFYKVVDAKLTFVRDAAGKVAKLTLHQNGMDQTAEKLPPDREPKPRLEVAVDAKVLQAHVGKYELAPNVVFDVRLDGRKLTAQLTGQMRFPLFPESDTKFFYKVVDAQITFVRDENGKTTALILHQGGIDQTAKRVE